MNDEFAAFQKTDGGRPWERELAQATGVLDIAGLQFGALWAHLIDEELRQGKKIEDVWEEAWTQADRRYQPSGSVQSFVVSILGRCWVHGRELERLYWPDEPHKWTK